MIYYLEVRPIHNETLMHIALVGNQGVVIEEKDLTGWKAERALLHHIKYIVKPMPTIMWDQVPTIHVAIGEIVGSHNISIYYLLPINYGDRCAKVKCLLAELQWNRDGPEILFGKWIASRNQLVRNEMGKVSN